ncbi:MAG: hypothetical protein L0241_28455 [Planctomycetia bacterium]|nr:hypothetical protein [Planctomycetia bacterium]
MKIVVEFTTAARIDLFALLAARMPTEGDAARFGAEFLTDMEGQFRDYDGLPPGAEKYSNANGTVWWWRYMNGIWAVYTLEDRTSWLFRAVRAVTVFAFEPLPPAP